MNDGRQWWDIDSVCDRRNLKLVVTEAHRKNHFTTTTRQKKANCTDLQQCSWNYCHCQNYCLRASSMDSLCQNMFIRSSIVIGPLVWLVLLYSFLLFFIGDMKKSYQISHFKHSSKVKQSPSPPKKVFVPTLKWVLAYLIKKQWESTDSIPKLA